MEWLWGVGLFVAGAILSCLLTCLAAAERIAQAWQAGRQWGYDEGVERCRATLRAWVGRQGGDVA